MWYLVLTSQLEVGSTLSFTITFTVVSAYSEAITATSNSMTNKRKKAFMISYKFWFELFTSHMYKTAYHHTKCPQANISSGNYCRTRFHFEKSTDLTHNSIWIFLIEVKRMPLKPPFLRSTIDMSIIQISTSQFIKKWHFNSSTFSHSGDRSYLRRLTIFSLQIFRISAL